MAAVQHSRPALSVVDSAMAFLPPKELAKPAAFAEELERLLDRCVPPLAIGQRVAVNQGEIIASLTLAAAHTDGLCKTVSTVRQSVP